MQLPNCLILMFAEGYSLILGINFPILEAKQKKTKRKNNSNNKKDNVSSYSLAFWEKMNAPEIQVKSLKMPQEGSLPSQVAGYKPATQLKSNPPTGIPQKPHPNLELSICFRNT